MQYLDTGGFGVLMTLLFVVFVLSNIFRARGKGKTLFVRRIAGLNAIDDAVGRAAEMGRPIVMVPGIGNLNAISVQAINIFAQVAERAVEFMTPIRVCCADPAVFTVAEEVIKDVYVRAGAEDRMDAMTVQFLTDRQFAFAAAVAGMILREKAAATFLLGEFYAESLIFAENANMVGAVQVAGSTQTTQTPFLVAACDYVLLGDEYYAASAYLTREPMLVGSLVGQDWAKMTIAAMVVIGVLVNSWNVQQFTTAHRYDDEDGGWSVMQPSAGGLPDRVKKGDWQTTRLFTPFVSPEMLATDRTFDVSWVRSHADEAQKALPKVNGQPDHDAAWIAANADAAVAEMNAKVQASNQQLLKDGADAAKGGGK